MKCMRLRRSKLPVVTLLVVPAALGCIRVGPTAEDQLEIVTDAVQTSFQSDAYSVLSSVNFSNLQDAVARVFRNTASIGLEYHDTNHNLPAPSESPNYPDWPPRTEFFSVYQNYAAEHHDTQTYPWVLFYVQHYAPNSTTECAGYVAGISNPHPPNGVPTDPTERWAFVFVTDIVHMEQTLCIPHATAQQLENQMIHHVTHEYGHQRAGLTHNDTTNAGFYHNGSVPDGRQDVMAFPHSYSELWGYTDPVFDAFGSESVGDNLTCRGNLLTNRSVP